MPATGEHLPQDQEGFLEVGKPEGHLRGEIREVRRVDERERIQGRGNTKSKEVALVCVCACAP